MFRQLSECIHRNQIRRAQPGLLSLTFGIRHFTADGLSFPPVELQKAEGLTVRTPAPLQPLLDNFRPFFSFIDRKVIGNEWGFRALAVLEVENDRSFRSPCLQFLTPSAPVPGMAEPVLKALRQKVEHIEDRRLTTAVRS